MKTAKLGAIFVISFMALAGTGAAYALWFDYLHLDVDVTTGWIGAEWSVEDYWDSEPPEKDFSKISQVQLLDWGDPAMPNARMFIHIVNAYPCIYYYVYFDIHNTGTIPIHIADPVIYLENLNQLNGYGSDYGTLDFIYGDGTPIDWSQVQIHPGGYFYGYIRIHFNNNLPQGTAEMEPIWVYCVQFPYHQWNEPYVPPGADG